MALQQSKITSLIIISSTSEQGKGMKGDFAVLLLVIALGSGCESTGSSHQSPLESSGVPVSELFAPPTSTELSNVQTIWSQRDLSARDVKIVYRESLPDGRLLQVMSHTSTGGKHFGAIISPAEGTPIPPNGFPIALSLAGFGPPFKVNVNTHPPSDSGLPPGITAIPAFRGHSLIVGDQEYQSEGPLFDHCDGGTDDILSFLNVVFKIAPRAGERVVATGGSRGGNTAMLASIRDDRIKRVVSMAGPDTYLIDSYMDNPNMQVSYNNWFLKDLTANQSSITGARERIIACSPLYFVEDIAPLQLHHGTVDVNVPFEVLARMKGAWIGKGRDPVELETYAYEGADHSFKGFIEKIRVRVTAFIRPVL